MDGKNVSNNNMVYMYNCIWSSESVIGYCILEIKYFFGTFKKKHIFIVSQSDLHFFMWVPYMYDFYFTFEKTKLLFDPIILCH